MLQNKPWLIMVMLIITAPRVFAQITIDTALNFNQRYTQCERKWVVFPQKDPTKGFTYGLIYLDEHAGFTFFEGGNFKIDNNGHYIADTAFLKNTSIRARLSRSTPKLSVLPP